jgi:hypothetical protein
MSVLIFIKYPKKILPLFIFIEVKIFEKIDRLFSSFSAKQKFINH